MKQKVVINATERYPEFYIDEDPLKDEGEVEVDIPTLKRWKKVAKDFETVQKEMRQSLYGTNP